MLAKSDTGANSNSLQAFQAKQAGTSTTTIEGTYRGDKKQGKPTGSGARWAAGSPAGLRHRGPSVPALHHAHAHRPAAPGGAQQRAGTPSPSPQRGPQPWEPTGTSHFR